MSYFLRMTLADIICFFRGHDDERIEIEGMYMDLPALHVKTKCKRCGEEGSFMHVSLNFTVKEDSEE